jgi:hypothetical protein
LTARAAAKGRRPPIGQSQSRSMQSFCRKKSITPFGYREI